MWPEKSLRVGGEWGVGPSEWEVGSGGVETQTKEHPHIHTNNSHVTGTKGQVTTDKYQHAHRGNDRQTSIGK